MRDAVPRWWLDGVDEVDHCVGYLEVQAASGLVVLVASPRQWLWRFVCLALLAGDAGLGFSRAWFALRWAGSGLGVSVFQAWACCAVIYAVCLSAEAVMWCRYRRHS